jgi:hypothetical protein
MRDFSDYPRHEPIRRKGKGLWYPPPGWRQKRRKEGKGTIARTRAIRRARKSKGAS